MLYIDATCINYDGNAFDAALIAMVAALKNSTHSHSRVRYLYTDTLLARLPKAIFDENTGRTLCTRKEQIPLEITRLPISMTFGIFDGYAQALFFDYPNAYCLACPQNPPSDRPDIIRGAAARYDIHSDRRRTGRTRLSSAAWVGTAGYPTTVYRDNAESMRRASESNIRLVVKHISLRSCGLRP